MMEQEGIEEEIRRLRKAFDMAEAVVVGAGSGLSTSAGFVYTGERLLRYFGDFVDRYGFRDMYAGGFYPYGTPEEHWAYWSRYIYINRYVKEPKPLYRELLTLLSGKEYFVLTTNVDHRFQKAGFEKARLFYTQGDYGLFQCSVPCHARTYDNKDKVLKMVLAQGFAVDEEGELVSPGTKEETDFTKLRMRVPSDLVPYCPVCGKPMSMNLRADDTFVEDEGWQEAAARYSAFLDAHRDARVLYLELGVGANTPVIIKYPFWRYTMENENATYACINYGEAFAPGEIAERSICINSDIYDIITTLHGTDEKGAGDGIINGG